MLQRVLQQEVGAKSEAELRAVDLESRRIEALRQTYLLDTERELEFDQVIELAAGICDTPISAFTLVDETRQWFKASMGVGFRELPREQSFCSHAIKQDGLFIIEDVHLDQRFAPQADKPDPGIRFYAGMPLAGPDGYLLGTLCVADVQPRQLSESQQTALRILATQLQSRVELRVQRRQLEAALHQQRTLMHTLSASHDRFATFMNNGPFLGYIKDAQGRFVFYNRRLAERFQISMTAWLGKSVFDLWPGEMGRVYAKNDLDALRSEKVLEVEEETIDKDGTVSYWRSSKFGFRNEEGEQWLGGFATDITAEVLRRRQLEQTNARLERVAAVDSLTGLLNRRMLDRSLEEAFAEARTTNRELSIVLLDLDHFKRRNDTYGHASGDAALRQTGLLLKDTMRATDWAGRYGGEELLLVLPRTDLRGAMAVASRVRQAINANEWPDAQVTASFGVASIDDTTQSVDDLVARADAAMYEAKWMGRNRVRGFRFLRRLDQNRPPLGEQSGQDTA